MLSAGGNYLVGALFCPLIQRCINRSPVISLSLKTQKEKITFEIISIDCKIVNLVFLPWYESAYLYAMVCVFSAPIGRDNPQI